MTNPSTSAEIREENEECGEVTKQSGQGSSEHDHVLTSDSSLAQDVQHEEEMKQGVIPTRSFGSNPLSADALTNRIDDVDQVSTMTNNVGDSAINTATSNEHVETKPNEIRSNPSSDPSTTLTNNLSSDVATGTPMAANAATDGLVGNQDQQAALLNNLVVGAPGVHPNITAATVNNPELAKAMLGLPGMTAAGLQGTLAAANNQNLLQRGIIPGATTDPNLINAGVGLVNAANPMSATVTAATGVTGQIPADSKDVVAAGLAGGTPVDRSKETPYTDYSRFPCPEDGTDLLGTNVTTSGKEPPFPVKLHRILSNAEYADFISWLPHGRSWRVLKPKAFEEKVIPLFFRHAKYASFMRQAS